IAPLELFAVAVPCIGGRRGQSEASDSPRGPFRGDPAPRYEWQRRPIRGVPGHIANRSELDKLELALLSRSREGGSIAPARARGFDEAQRGRGRKSCSG